MHGLSIVMAGLVPAISTRDAAHLSEMPATSAGMTRRRARMHNTLKLLTVLGLLACAPAHADIAISANDAHSSLIEGVGGAVKDPPPDNVAVIDLAQSPPKITATVEVGTSVLGPGQGVYVAKDESFAIVVAGNRAENGAIVPDNRVS